MHESHDEPAPKRGLLGMLAQLCLAGTAFSGAALLPALAWRGAAERAFGLA